MSGLYKLFSKVITKRLTKILNENQPPDQTGFQAGYSTIDHLHEVNQIIEKVPGAQFKSLHCICRLQKKLSILCIKKELCPLEGKVYKDRIYRNSTAKIRLDTEGQEFALEREVKQGDPISPKLFTCLLEDLFHSLKWEKYGININGRKLLNLPFADDIILFASSAIELNDMLVDLNNVNKE